MVTVPVIIPVTTPVLLLIVAIAVFDELHTPPLVALLKVIWSVTAVTVLPVIAATIGNAFTVTVVLTESTQPFALVTVYLMIEVPALTPDTKPVLLIVATLVLVDDHIPFAVASATCVVEAAQTLVVPVIGAITGNAFTVTVVETESIQHLHWLLYI
jgi:hypothetical protein